MEKRDQMTTKKLLAINNETGERIEFDVGDIATYEVDGVEWRTVRNNFHLEEILQHHTLYYLHEGKYYNYETGKEMV